jgi:predicted AAA+ superfamily ATPase
MAKKTYYQRNIDRELLLWSKDADRKVLLLRGARQVGKSSAVRNLGKSFKYFVEINFDDADEQLKNLFQPGVSPQEICMQLSALTLVPIVPGETLLFLDEIQTCLPAILKLRYFYEQYPELHVVAAGSLLEFALEEISSFGVGRVRCQRQLNDILVSFRNDFVKYKKRVPSTRINEVFDSVAQQSEGKFVYEKASVQSSNRQIKDALNLLIMAGLVYPVTHTAANGIPLGAEVNIKFQRMFLFDTGLFQRILELNISNILLADDFKTVNRGALAEIFVGLELVKDSSCYSPTPLYYWQREKSQSSAQIDFLVQSDDTIIPIEVKSGTVGKMQSMNLFLKEKQLDYGIRTSLENFAKYDNIQVYPLYAIGNVVRK